MKGQCFPATFASRASVSGWLRAQGFSLVELLLVVAIIGLVAAIALPSLSNVNTAAKDARNDRNAQNIASVFATGAAAGVPWAANSLGAAVNDVITGRAAADGAFSGRVFRYPLESASESDMVAVKSKLSLSSDSQLLYNPQSSSKGAMSYKPSKTSY